MNLFFSDKISSDKIILPINESKHCLYSLRKKINDHIHVMDGKGTIYSTQINSIHSGHVICIKPVIYVQEKNTINISICIAPPKNRTRFEWFLEKVTEIGVNNITPILCQNSERKKINYERSNKIILSASKQSQNCIIPKLNEFKKFNNIIKNDSENKFIAHCQQSQTIKFKRLIKSLNKIKEVLILIGPEGDFSEKEILLAENNSFKSVNLSSKRLRTETAGIVACNMIHTLL